jgi:hypothetical protein
MIQASGIRSDHSSQTPRPVFTVNGHTFDRYDIVAAAMLRGEWSAVEDQVRNGLACATRADEDGLPVSSDLEQAARQFRYDRKLITAEETEAWFEQVGVTFDAWQAYLQRSELKRVWIDELETIRSRHPVGDDDVAECILADTICSGALERFAAALAGRAAVCASTADAMTDIRELDEGLIDQVRRACDGVFQAGLPAEDRRTGIVALARLDSSFHALTRNALTREAIRGQVDAHQIEWLNVHWRYIDLADGDMAREALLCLHDGESLDDVAAEAKIGIGDEHLFLECLEPAVRATVLSARPGDPLGPVVMPSGYRLAIVDAKTAPTAEDPAVRRRAEERLVAALVAQHSAQIHWHEPI